MDAEIRPLESHEDFRAMELLGREIWGMEDIEVIPSDLTKTVARNGGVVIGAFAPHLVGFVFGFLGRQNGVIKHHSHIAGVAREVQNQDIGYRLKLAQRDAVMRDGIELITWTFDPLESRNARFNFHKLGVTCNTYMRDAYGAMRDQLNAGLPSDRFQVDWHIKSDRVIAAINKKVPEQSVSTLIASGVPLIDSAESIKKEGQMLIEIPSNFQSLKAESREAAMSWRLRTRDLFERAFSNGLIATDLLVEDGRSFYLFEL